MPRYITPDEAVVCPATTKAGAPCQVTFGMFGADGRCLWHSEDPETVAHRRGVQARGTQGSMKKAGEELPPLEIPADPETIEDARKYLAWLARSALTGQIEPRQVEAANKALLTWIKAEDYARQIRELRKMITDLQKTVKRP